MSGASLPRRRRDSRYEGRRSHELQELALELACASFNRRAHRPPFVATCLRVAARFGGERRVVAGDRIGHRQACASPVASFAADLPVLLHAGVKVWRTRFSRSNGRHESLFPPLDPPREAGARTDGNSRTGALIAILRCDAPTR